MNNSKYMNWKSYWLRDQYDEYKLFDSDTVKTFFTDDQNMAGEFQINYLNKYLGELPMMYYIWKNNLKSEVITISSYRRDVSNIDFEQITNHNKIQSICMWSNYIASTYDIIKEQKICDSNIIDIWYDTVKDIFGFSDDEIENLKTKTDYYRMAIFVFSCKWEQYCKMCELIFGFLDKLFPNESWKNIENLENFCQEQKQKSIELGFANNKNGWPFDLGNRYPVFLIEHLCSVTLCNVFDVFVGNDSNIQKIVCDMQNTEHNFVEMARFIKANRKTNAIISFVNGTNSLEDNINYLMNYSDIGQVNKLYFNKYFGNDDTIRLKLNEYIEVDSAYSFYNKEYKIKKR